jgi:hypothetical protein
VKETFEKRCLASGEAIDIGADVFTQKYEGIVRFAAKHAIAIDRQAIGNLSLEQITGLGDAAREGLDAFRASLSALGLSSAERVEDVDQETGEVHEHVAQAPAPPPKLRKAERQAEPAPQPKTTPKPELFGDED